MVDNYQKSTGFYFMEQWKDIKNFEGLYQVSNQGRIRSLDSYNLCKSRSGNTFVRRRVGRILKLQLHNGYLHTTLSNVNITTVSIHRVVAQAFIPNPENKVEVNHKDGNKQNNNDWNLEWVTPKENGEHASTNGLLNVGSKHRIAKLDETKVKEIRNMLLNEECPTERIIGEIYGISQSVVNNIKSRKTWKHVK